MLQRAKYGLSFVCLFNAGPEGDFQKAINAFAVEHFAKSREILRERQEIERKERTLVSIDF